MFTGFEVCFSDSIQRKKSWNFVIDLKVVVILFVFTINLQKVIPDTFLGVQKLGDNKEKGYRYYVRNSYLVMNQEGIFKGNQFIL